MLRRLQPRCTLWGYPRSQPCHCTVVRATCEMGLTLPQPQTGCAASSYTGIPAAAGEQLDETTPRVVCVRARLLHRLDRAPLSPRTALALLRDWELTECEPRVVQRIATVIAGNALQLDAGDCVRLMPRLVGAPIAVSAAAAASAMEVSSRGDDDAARMRVLLQPLEGTLLRAVAAHVCVLTESMTPAVPAAECTADQRRKQRRVGTHAKPLSSTVAAADTPLLCALLLAFAAQSSCALASGMTEDTLMDTLSRTVVRPALDAYFSGRAESAPARARDADATRAALHPRGPRGTAAGRYRGACSSSVSGSAVWAWLELLLRAGPQLPSALERRVADEAWRALAQVIPAKHTIATATAAATVSDSLTLVSGVLRRLPTLVRCDEDCSAEAPETDSPSLLLPAAYEIAWATVWCGKTCSWPIHVRALHRLLVEWQAGQSSRAAHQPLALRRCGTGDSGVHFHSLMAAFFSTVARERYATVTAELEDAAEGALSHPRAEAFEEERWLEETDLVAWHACRLVQEPTDAGAEPRASCELAMRALLLLGLRVVAVAAHHTSAQALELSVPLRQRRTSQATGETAETAACAPSLVFLLRYVQCWQQWLPLLSEDARLQLLRCATRLLRDAPTRDSFPRGSMHGSAALHGARSPLGASEASSDAPDVRGQGARRGCRVWTEFTARHEQMLALVYGECLADVASPTAPPVLLVLFSIAELTRLLASANDPWRGCRGEHTRSCDSPAASGTERPDCAAAAAANVPSSADRLSVGLLSTDSLRRLRRHTLSALQRTRHQPHLHRMKSRCGGRRHLRRRPRQRVEGDAGARGLSDPFEFLVSVPPTQSASGTDPTARSAWGGWAVYANCTAEDGAGCGASGSAGVSGAAGAAVLAQGRWEHAYLPAVVHLCAALGGAFGCGSGGPFTLVESAPRRPSGVRVSTCVPASVGMLMDDLSTLSFLTNLRQDVHDMDTEVYTAYAVLVASELRAAMSELACSHEQLHTGVMGPSELPDTQAEAVDTASVERTSNVPFLLSVFGVPVPLSTAASGCTAIGHCFLWQQAAAVASISPSAGGLPATTAGGATHVMGALAIRPFFLTGRVTTPHSSCAQTALNCLQRSFAYGQCEYALALLQFGSMTFFSDAMVCGRPSLPSLALPAHADRLEDGGLLPRGRPRSGGAESAAAARRSAHALRGCTAVPSPRTHRARLTVLPYQTLIWESFLCSSLATAAVKETDVPVRVPRSDVSLWASGTYSQHHLPTLWKCLQTLFSRFCAMLECDLLSCREASDSDAARGHHRRMDAIRRDPRRYYHLLHERLLGDLDDHGEPSVSAMGVQYLVPFFTRVGLRLSADSDVGSVPGKPPERVPSGLPSSLLLDARQCRAALHALFLLPTTAFSFVSPASLLQLWRAAARAERTPGSAGPPCTAHVEDSMVGGALTAEDVDALTIWYVAIRLAQLLDGIKREACEHVALVAASRDSAAQGQPKEYSPCDRLMDRELGSAQVFQHAIDSPFDVLDTQVCALRERLAIRTAARSGSAADALRGSLPGTQHTILDTPKREKEAHEEGVEWDPYEVELPSSVVFSAQSVAMAECMSRTLSYSVDGLLQAIREDAANSLMLFIPCDRMRLSHLANRAVHCAA